jgi:hypothetical protein
MDSFKAIQKCMKTLHLLSIFSALILTSGMAQEQVGPSLAPARPNGLTGPPAVATTSHDGFWLQHKVPVMTQFGVTTPLTDNVSLPNGLRVQKNGTVTLLNGTKSELQENRLLTFDGQFIQLPSTMEIQAGTVPAVPNVSRADRKEIGLSSRDGITVSGTDVLITRNGVTDKVTTDLKMPNGAVVRPDGRVTLANGKHIVLRPDQLLDLHGVLREAPPQPNPPGPAPSSSTPNQ